MSGRTYPPGVPCWIDTTQPDIDAAATFYAGLFGWTFREATPGGGADRYLVAQLDGADVAGIAGGREDPPAWSTYIAVEDVDAVVDRLVAAGAVLQAPATDAGEDGRSAALADPEGVEFRLWQPKRQGGAQSVNQPGTWNFSDLHTRSPEAAVGFYQAAFGWQVDKVGFGDDADFGLMVRLPGYGDHLAATADPDIRERQSEFAAPPASQTPSPGSCRLEPTRPRIGTSRSPSPTGTAQPSTPNGSGPRSFGRTTPGGRARP